MEKYRKFSDPATSCNPFLPASIGKPSKERILNQLIRFSVMGLILTARIPLILAVSVFVGISDILCMVPLVSGLLFRPAIRPLFSWLLLALFGIFTGFSAHQADLRRLKMRPGTVSPKLESLAVVSYHGFVDVLVHSAVTRPNSFVFQSLDGKLVACMTVIGAIYYAMNSPLLTYNESVTVRLREHSVLFVSPSPSNGQGILGINGNLLVSACKGKAVTLAVIEYNSCGPQDAHHLTDSWEAHILKLALNWGCSARIIVSPRAISISNPQEVSEAKSFLARLFNPVASETDIDPSRYLEFRNYWIETQKGDYAKSK